MAERICLDCRQILDEGFFYHSRGICDYCWAMKGMDYASEREDVTTFGEMPGAGRLDVNFDSRDGGKPPWSWD